MWGRVEYKLEPAGTNWNLFLSHYFPYSKIGDLQGRLVHFIRELPITSPGFLVTKADDTVGAEGAVKPDHTPYPWDVPVQQLGQMWAPAVFGSSLMFRAYKWLLFSYICLPNLVHISLVASSNSGPQWEGSSRKQFQLGWIITLGTITAHPFSVWLCLLSMWCGHIS